ncbi:MAG: hypothetical protein AVDCRST_MAG61-2034, partial [uncultured Friedmanniella sp.]
DRHDAGRPAHHDALRGPRRRGPRCHADRPTRRRRRRHRPGAAARRGRRTGGRVRVRQDHRRDVAARLLPGRCADLGRQGDARGPRRPQAAVEGGPAAAWRGDRLRPAGPGVGAEPEHPDRQAARRAARAPRHRHQRVAAAGRPRGPGRGRPAQRRRVPPALRPPAVGRPGAAG